MSKLSVLVLLMFSIYWVIVSAGTPGILAVKFTVTNAAAGTTGGARFDKEVGARFTQTIMAQSTKLIWNAFNNLYNKSIKQVTLYIADMPDKRVDAITTGDKINVSASYIAGFYGNLTNELKGIVYREMTRVWQQNANGTAPGFILGGIADFMRLKACLVASHWAVPGGGTNWKENTMVTARFLDYWDYVEKRYVSTLNEMMTTRYADSYLTEISGMNLTSMWMYYKANASKVLQYNCGHK